MQLTADNISDYTGAKTVIGDLPESANNGMADRGHDADRHRKGLKKRGTFGCIPTRKNRMEQISHDGTLYRQRHGIDNTFARVKEGRRFATQGLNDAVYLSAWAMAAVAIHRFSVLAPAAILDLLTCSQGICATVQN